MRNIRNIPIFNLFNLQMSFCAAVIWGTFYVVPIIVDNKSSITNALKQAEKLNTQHQQLMNQWKIRGIVVTTRENGNEQSY